MRCRQKEPRQYRYRPADLYSIEMCIRDRATSCCDDVIRQKNFKEVSRQILSPAEGKFGIQIPAGAWHTINVIEPSVIFEAKDGAYRRGDR